MSGKRLYGVTFNNTNFVQVTASNPKEAVRKAVAEWDLGIYGDIKIENAEDDANIYVDLLGGARESRHFYKVNFVEKQPSVNISKSFEVVINPNTKEYYVYSNDYDTYIILPPALLKKVKRMDTLQEGYDYLTNLVKKNNPKWLYDKNNWYRGEL